MAFAWTAVGTCAVALAAGAAAALPIAPHWPPGGATAIEDRWTLAAAVAAPPGVRELMAPRPAPAGERHWGALIFPDPAVRAPVPPTPLHEAVAGERPTADGHPADPDPPPLDGTPGTADEPVEDEEAPAEIVSEFAFLMRGGPEATRVASRFGLRDALGAGIALRDGWLTVAKAAPPPADRPEPAAEEEADDEEDILTPSQSPEGDARAALIGIGGLFAVALVVSLILFRGRTRTPKRLASRRFG